MAEAERTAGDIAAAMLAMMEERGGSGLLYQEVAMRRLVLGTPDRDRFARRNRNGNWAFTPDVLAAFRKLTGDRVVWSRSEQYWRWRRDTDPPGRQVRV